MITAAAAATSQVSGLRPWVPVSRDSVSSVVVAHGVLQESGHPRAGRPAAGRRPGRPRAGAPAARRRRARVTGSSLLSTPHVRHAPSIFRSCSRELLPGPVQPDARRVRRDVEDGRDLAGRQLLPRPQAEQLGVVGPQPRQRLGQRRRRPLAGAGHRLGGRVDRPRSARPAAAAGAPPRSALARQLRATPYAHGSASSGHLVEPAPADQQRVGEHVVGGRRVGTPGQEPPQRLDQPGGERLETGSPVIVHGPHVVTCPAAGRPFPRRAGRSGSPGARAPRSPTRPRPA